MKRALLPMPAAAGLYDACAQRPACEVLARITLLRTAWRDADWRWLAWLPETPLRLVIGALLGAGSTSLLGAQTLQHALWWAPAMLIGIWVGRRGFKRVSPARFRELVLNLLIVIAALGVLRALWALSV